MNERIQAIANGLAHLECILGDVDANGAEFAGVPLSDIPSSMLKRVVVYLMGQAREQEAAGGIEESISGSHATCRRGAVPGQ